MLFPRLVFRAPGPHQCQGGTYDHALVEDGEAHEAQLAAGWFDTLPEALAPAAPPTAPAPKAPKVAK